MDKYNGFGKQLNALTVYAQITAACWRPRPRSRLKLPNISAARNVKVTEAAIPALLRLWEHLSHGFQHAPDACPTLSIAQFPAVPHSRARIPVLIILAAVSGLCYLTLYYNSQLAKVFVLPLLIAATGILPVETILLFICVNRLSEDATSSPAEGLK